MVEFGSKVRAGSLGWRRHRADGRDAKMMSRAREAEKRLLEIIEFLNEHLPSYVEIKELAVGKLRSVCCALGQE
jgi:hypothetical protein